MTIVFNKYMSNFTIISTIKWLITRNAKENYYYKPRSVTEDNMGNVVAEIDMATPMYYHGGL
jgi:hypothetical protein